MSLLSKRIAAGVGLLRAQEVVQVISTCARHDGIIKLQWCLGLVRLCNGREDRGGRSKEVGEATRRKHKLTRPPVAV